MAGDTGTSGARPRRRTLADDAARRRAPPAERDRPTALHAPSSRGRWPSASRHRTPKQTATRPGSRNPPWRAGCGPATEQRRRAGPDRRSVAPRTRTIQAACARVSRSRAAREGMRDVEVVDADQVAAARVEEHELPSVQSSSALPNRERGRGPPRDTADLAEIARVERDDAVAFAQRERPDHDRRGLPSAIRTSAGIRTRGAPARPSASSVAPPPGARERP